MWNARLIVVLTICGSAVAQPGPGTGTLSGLFKLQNYVQKRVSSYDRAGFSRNRSRADAHLIKLGTDKSRGYCLEMICADFLAGANLNGGDPDVLLHALSRSFHFLPANQRQLFLQTVSGEVQ